MSWPQLASVLVTPTCHRSVVELQEIARSWQQIGGLVVADSWEPTRVSLLNANGVVLDTTRYRTGAFDEAVYLMLREKGL